TTGPGSAWPAGAPTGGPSAACTAFASGAGPGWRRTPDPGLSGAGRGRAAHAREESLKKYYAFCTGCGVQAFTTATRTKIKTTAKGARPGARPGPNDRGRNRKPTSCAPSLRGTPRNR